MKLAAAMFQQDMPDAELSIRERNVEQERKELGERKKVMVTPNFVANSITIQHITLEGKILLRNRENEAQK